MQEMNSNVVTLALKDSGVFLQKLRLKFIGAVIVSSWGLTLITEFSECSLSGKRDCLRI